MTLSPPVLAGNWKMHLGPTETARFFADFLVRYAPATDRTVLFFPPAVSLTSARDALRGRADIGLGVQNIHWEDLGAYTGETSAPLAWDAGATFALVGHSERRHVFAETIEETERKVRAALRAGLRPVLCVGETLDERRGGVAEAVVARQLAGVLDELPAAGVDALLLAYEPVWAIGTGETASPADATAMHAAIRGDLVSRFGASAGSAIPILYGGSVKPDNARDLLAAEEVDGVLVGGASLDPAGFAAICAAY